jgi:hypothetical protein
MTDPRLALVLALLALPGCAHPASLCAPFTGICADGLPVRTLVDPQCPRGDCGYSCLPDRWLLTPAEDP